MRRNGQGKARAIDTIARAALWTLLGLAVAIFLALAIVPHLGLYRPVTVLSGSMRPTFSPGDLIIVRPERMRDVRVGQVISYHVPGGLRQLETHRVIRVLHAGDTPVVQTQGDANNWRDPWTAKLHGPIAWRYSFTVPYAGYGISALRSHRMHVASIIVAPALIALLLLAQVWGISLRPRRRHA